MIDSAVGLRDLTDGTSNTAVMSESLKGPGGAASTIPEAGPIDPQAMFVHVNVLGLTDADCAASTTWGVRRNGNRPDGDYPNGLYDHSCTPNSRRPDCIRHGNPAWKAARSRHPGGVNALFGDGTVRFVKGGVAPAPWRATATRSLGEVVSADAL